MKKTLRTKDKIKIINYLKSKNLSIAKNAAKMENLMRVAKELESKLIENEVSLRTGNNDGYFNLGVDESGKITSEMKDYEKKYKDLFSAIESLLPELKRNSEMTFSLICEEVNISDNPAGIIQLAEMSVVKIKKFQSEVMGFKINDLFNIRG